jgi:hypothetical protein
MLYARSAANPRYITFVSRGLKEIDLMPSVVAPTPVRFRCPHRELRSTFVAVRHLTGS